MKKIAVFALILFCLSIAGSDTFLDGVMTGSENVDPGVTLGRQFTVVDSFTGPFGYSLGLACDGYYIWNNHPWGACSIARLDPVTHSLVTMFTPSFGNRDMAFDGTYLWASHWNTNSIYKYDTATLAIVASYDPPFAGHANGMAWDGAYLWVGEEDGRIYKMNTIGDTIRSIPFNAAYPSDPRGLGFSSDGHLWVGHQGYGRVYEIDTITGAILNWYPAPGHVPGVNFQQGVDFGNGYLWTTSGGTYNRIYKIDIGLVKIEERRNAIEPRISLGISPNPSRDNTVINFSIERPATVILSVLDASGRMVAVLVNDQKLVSGRYQYRLTDELKKSGIYFVVLRADDFMESVKLIIL